MYVYICIEFRCFVAGDVLAACKPDIKLNQGIGTTNNAKKHVDIYSIYIFHKQTF